ncbi:MAG: hypothetical protein K8T25_23745 [Planctomycetia bacterium]|nr:hypothetical protein [Planctomycetia bacterium]
MEKKPVKRRRFQFNLRTVFVLVTVAAAMLAVAVPVTRYAIRERQRKEVERIMMELQQLPHGPLKADSPSKFDFRKATRAIKPSGQAASEP